MKINFVTLNIDNYQPEITKYTIPSLQKYAKKINAEFIIIEERMFSDYPIPYEKFQMFNLRDDDYNIFCDADIFLTDTFPDILKLYSRYDNGFGETVLTYQQFEILKYFKPNIWFNRLDDRKGLDGRTIKTGPSASFVVTKGFSNWIWNPINIELDDRFLWSKKQVDEYNLTLNLAYYKFKHYTFGNPLYPGIYHVAIDSLPDNNYLNKLQGLYYDTFGCYPDSN